MRRNFEAMGIQVPKPVDDQADGDTCPTVTDRLVANADVSSDDSTPWIFREIGDGMIPSDADLDILFREDQFQ
jgi:hypothetical protein